MIAKIGKGENMMGAISYNQRKVDIEKGLVLFTHKIPETLNGGYTTAHLYRAFEPYLLANNKTEKPVLHISLNPDPGDTVSDSKFIAMAQDYMQEMGYGKQPFAVFKHTDIERAHIHIVSTNVAIDGRKISDRFDHHRSMEICRELEKRYQLKQAKEQRNAGEGITFKPVDYKKGNIKSQVEAVVRHIPEHYRFQGLGSYNALLSLFNITCEEVKGELQGQQKSGLVYFALNEKGEKASNPFKASLFGSHAGYTSLQEHFEKSRTSLKTYPTRNLLKRTVEIAFHTATDENAFKRQLLDQGINTVVRRNGQGRIYGITFIDHSSKSIWNGSQLHKDLSATVFNDWWNNDRKTSVSQADAIPPEKQVTPEENNSSNQDLFEFLSRDIAPSFGEENNLFAAFGGLLPEAQGEDYDEAAFAGKMKKKKKGRNKN